MGIARQASMGSKCLSRQFGAIIVKNKTVVSMAYNGPAKGISHCWERTYGLPEGVDPANRPPECPRRLSGYASGQGLEYCTSGHAERNAIAHAAMNGISTLDTEIYTWSPLPCKECAISIVNAGIKKVTYADYDYDNVARFIFEEAGIELVCFDSKVFS